jgi:hypothetical protein
MQNRSVWFFRGSASVSDAGFGVAPKRSLLNSTISITGNTQEESAIARRARQHPRRVRYPIVFAAVFGFAEIVCHAQQATPTPSPSEAEVESVIVSATRFDIPLDQSPASASVVSSEELEQKQNPTRQRCFA